MAKVSTINIHILKYLLKPVTNHLRKTDLNNQDNSAMCRWS